MAVILPAQINLHTQSNGADPLGRGNIGAPTSTGTKSAGNLPITNVAAQYIADTAGTVEGLSWDVPTPFDSTADTKVVVWGWQFNAPNRIQTDTVANDGIIFRIYSGTGDNYRQFRIGGNDTVAGSSQGGPLPVVIDPQATSFQTEVGTFDLSDITGYGFANKRLNLSGGSTSQVFFIRAFLFGTAKDDADIIKFTGVSDFSDITDAVLGSDYTTKIHAFVAVAGSTYTLLCPWQVGDAGSTATTFDDAGATVLSPSSNDPKDPRFHLSEQAMRVHLSLGAADSVSMSGIYVWGSPSDFNFDSSVGATVTLDGAAFNGMGDFSIGSDVTVSGTTFSLASGSKVIDSGANLDGIIVNGEIEITTVRDISNVQADKVTLTQAGTYNFSGSTIAEVENTSGGAISIISDSAIPTVTGTISVIDSFLSFSGIDSWSVHSTEADRDANTGVLDSGVAGETYVFSFTGGVTYYVRALVSGTIVLLETTPLAAGETVVELSIAALLATLPTAEQISDAVWDEVRSEHATAGTTGAALKVINDGIQNASLIIPHTTDVD